MTLRKQRNIPRLPHTSPLQRNLLYIPLNTEAMKEKHSNFLKFGADIKHQKCEIQGRYNENSLTTETGCETATLVYSVMPESCSGVS